MTALAVAERSGCTEMEAYATLEDLRRARLAFRVQERWLAAHWACRLAALATAGDEDAQAVLRLLNS